MLRTYILLPIAFCLAPGCGILPSDGPQTQDIIRQAQIAITPPEAEQRTLPYDLVRLDYANVDTFRVHSEEQSFSLPTTSGGLSDISVGDKLLMTLWEDQEVSLLSTPAQRATEIQVEVDLSGHIEVPYVGRVLAAGRTPSAVRQVLVDLYGKQTLNPEVTLTLTSSVARTATVLGDVRTDGRIDLPLQSLSLLELLASAGGPQEPSWEVDVQVIRGRAQQNVLLHDILRNSRNNVTIARGDIVHVTHSPRLFTVLGAVNNPGAVEVDQSDVSLLDVLAAAGGLATQRADPSAVFIYRDAPSTNGRPRVFLLDLNQVDSLFLGERFDTYPNDIMYVGVADAVTLNQLVSLFFSPLNSVSQSLKSN